MKRRTGILFLTALCLIAQSGRDAYRSAYKTWREAEPSLEKDAATAGDALAARSTHAAEAAAKYGTARAAFLRGLADDQAQNTLWLQSTVPQNLPALAPAGDETSMINAASSRIATNIATFANDPDRGIQQLRTSLEKERDALASLSAAVTEREKAENKTAQAVADLDHTRQASLEQYQAALAPLSSSTALVDKETAAWASYYQKLSQGARGIAPAPLVSALPNSQAPASPNPAPAPQRAPSITPLPLARYTGAWTYPTVGGMFHGAEPEFVDLVVHEEGGRADGTFYARFKTPAGADPLIRFDFSGDFKPTRNQTFSLTTSDGAKGTIDLIPGNAFNLLEVNFQTGPITGKIRAADLLLVKK